MLKTASELLLSSAADGADLRTVDPETQARLDALLEAAGTERIHTHTRVASTPVSRGSVFSLAEDTVYRLGLQYRVKYLYMESLCSE